MVSSRRRRVTIAVAAAVAGIAATGCEPGASGGLSAVAAAVTTDRTATSTLERLRFDVRWLSCTGKAAPGIIGSVAPSSSPPAPVTVDCRGETGSGQRITITGKVTREIEGRCVHGELTAKVGRKTVFEATMLGDCGAQPTATATVTPPPTESPWPTRPPSTVTATVTPAPTAPPEPPPTPAVTVTVTVAPKTPPTPTPVGDPRPSDPNA
ncbi:MULTISPECIES: hypothetical protein [Streptomyces]|uniref:Lipoprotein n=1 Tax=Streptomyces chengmaiensis TaxID=3040919 RepID=A0ABT6HRC6_9ACTN|nr:MULTISPECIES: hypothetical protein [Streptomyces]MDH2391273.1 hypothetical protein [Streptomyces chengmaiensis]WRQ79377.1 hypothetical protein I3F59_008380 [Streptomyces sp. MUM 178J]